MKERSRERMAQLLLEELLAELGESEKVKRMLGDLTALPVDEVVAKLLEDMEAAIGRRQAEALELLKTREQAAPSPVPETKKAAPRVPPEAPHSGTLRPDARANRRSVQDVPRVVPVPPEPPRVSVEPPPPPVSAAPAPPPALVEPSPPPAPVNPPAPVVPVDAAPSPVSIEPPAPPVPAEPPAPPAGPPPSRVRQTRSGGSDALFWGELEKTIRREETVRGPVLPAEDAAAEAEEEFQGSLAEASTGELRTATEFTDEDIVYVHGVTMIPAREAPVEKPFMLEEKGIDGRSFAFAFDYEGMRFYLSKILPSVMNVSKTGMLLLGKQESVQARSAHESALNELRLHGILLPFEFGTLARGRDNLMGKVDAVRERLVEAIETIQATRWWIVKLFVLDARIAQIVGKEDPGPARKGRVVERASYTKLPVQKKFDIKVLERILGKEKRIAESVHEELKNMVERSDIDMIVGLGSGSSEDWKLILEASYEVKGSSLTKFFQTVTDLQYRHLTIDLMLSVAGDAEPFAFG